MHCKFLELLKFEDLIPSKKNPWYNKGLLVFIKPEDSWSLSKQIVAFMQEQFLICHEKPFLQVNLFTIYSVT